MPDDPSAAHERPGAGPVIVWAGSDGRQDGGTADATVLVVDDEQANVALLERMLRAAGISRVHGITDPREVLTSYRQLDPDLVLLDLHMPHLDGFAVLDALARVVPPHDYVPVLVLTADDTPETKQRALAAGAKDFLTKPFDHTEVVLRVKNLLETRALYVGLRRHNAALAAQVREHGERDRRDREEHQRKTERIERVLRGVGPTMVFQAIAELASGEVVGAEALARFAGEPRRSPDVWFAEAEEVGLGIELELAAVRAAVARFPDLPARAYLSVNVSPGAVVTGRVGEVVPGVAGERLVLELTEHARVADYDELVEALKPLRTRGTRVAVDDAGAGFAGLVHILRLLPDIIKLDIGLTRGIDHDPVRRALALSLVGFARDIGGTIVAEGIETAEELEALHHLGVTWGQGYFLARPGPEISATVSLPVPRR
jgi:EAL domain-containing protein (putative c-di-GMP-specific phosphodiesterase class I)